MLTSDFYCVAASIFVKKCLITQLINAFEISLCHYTTLSYLAVGTFC